MKVIINIISLCLFSSLSFAQILIDEQFDDWTSDHLIYTDDIREVASNRLDLHQLWMSNDAENIYLRFTIDNFKISLQESNDISIYLDYDQNINTGRRQENLGAELLFNFGNRNGQLVSAVSSTDIRDDDIRLISIPTVTSTNFELAIRRRNRIGGTIIEPGSTINVLLSDGMTGDQIPRTGEVLSYTLVGTEDRFTSETSLARPMDTDLRIMSLNALRDQISEPDRWDNYERVIRAIAPDIIAFQEIYDSGASDISNLLNNWYTHPSGPWAGMRVAPDIILCTPYPIKQTANIRGNGAFLVDYKGQDIFIINAHLFCCENDLGRQEEVDEIMAFIRNAQQGRGAIPITNETPIIIIGDMNFVGLDNQRETILSGDIDNETNYGPDFNPDWDATNLSMADTYVTGAPFAYTWRGDNGSFGAGRLDYIFYSDAVMRNLNSFALNTNTMSLSDRVKYGLNLSDSDQISDHLACAVDFDILSLTDLPNIAFDDLISLYPNPTSAQLNLSIPDRYTNLTLQLDIYDLLGRRVLSHTSASDNTLMTLDLTPLTTGPYLLKIYQGQTLIGVERFTRN